MYQFFKPLPSASAKEEATLRGFQQSAAAAAEQQSKLQLPPRGPGRPRKIMAAPPAQLAESADPDADAPPSKRTHQNWLLSPFIHDILAAYELCGRSARRTVEHLQRKHPRLPTEIEARYERLSESTIRGWHESGTAAKKLLPQNRALIAEQPGSAAIPCGSGRTRALSKYPELEAEMKSVFTTMRERGAVVNLLVVRLVMRESITRQHPEVLDKLKISKSWCSAWVRENLDWSWRCRTTAAAKVPEDWREQGVMMAKRIAYNMQLFKVHPSLVINMDQTGVHLAPVDSRTYDPRGSKAVKVIGSDDKRQITVCVASSLHGDLRPLQLIFQGKTSACHPPETATSRAAGVHMTHSENHWSSQETMQQWITEVLLPYAARRIIEQNLPHDSRITLVLDVWSVHISEEFRLFLRTHHPRIHLVFVPANCTSQLQVADVILQRPFKHGIRQEFNVWAAAVIKEQIDKNDMCGLSPYLKMSVIKPNVLDWCVASWTKLQQGREYIKMGWHTCCASLYNVHDVAKRQQVIEEVSALRCPNMN